MSKSESSIKYRYKIEKGSICVEKCRVTLAMIGSTTCSECNHNTYYNPESKEISCEMLSVAIDCDSNELLRKTQPSVDTETSALDIQVGGDHYKRMKIQPIEFIIANDLGFSEGSVVKYVCRHEFKNGVEDLKKAKHYLDILIEKHNGANKDSK